jgi:hypothetical protein
VTHSNVHFLSSNDIFFDSWNESDVLKKKINLICTIFAYVYIYNRSIVMGTRANEMYYKVVITLCAERLYLSLFYCFMILFEYNNIFILSLIIFFILESTCEFIYI